MQKLCMLGDVYLTHPTEVLDLLDTDIIFNLEYAFCDNKALPTMDKVVLRSDYNWISDFHNQVKAVSLANNHMLDYGINGLIQTISFLNTNHISYFGAGQKEDNYHNPYIYEAKEKRIAFLGYCSLNADYEIDSYGVAPFSEKQFLKDYELCQSKNIDCIIVYIHWGVEENPNMTEKQKHIGHYLIDHGCEMVIGQHSHCIQPIEEYKGKLICYSLGNAVFPNFKVPAFCNEQGIPKLMYRKRQSRWNKESLGVFFQLDTLKVEEVAKFEYKDDQLCLMKHHYPFPHIKSFGNLITYYRKLSSMIKSNVCIDGKLVDISYFVNEISLKQKQMKGVKLK